MDNTVTAPTVAYLDLREQEIQQVESLLDAIGAQQARPEDPHFIEDAPRLAYELPDRLVAALRHFRLHENAGALVIRGLPVADEEIGPTPSNWRDHTDRTTTRRQEYYLMLACALLGDVFGWSTLQGGRLIHDVVPMPTEKQEQSGHGTVRLEWHTEDGFHPHRCDYLLLLGLRNHDRVPTTLAGIDDVMLTEQHRKILAEPRFLIRPDMEHLKRAADLVGTTGGSHRMQQLRDAPEPCAVLFGDPTRPYLRIDPTFMATVPGDAEAKEALDEVVSQLDGRLLEVALTPGDLLVVDNYRMVHGRNGFEARFDGTDRWLKKAVVSRDLRRSRALRERPGSRILM